MKSSFAIAALSGIAMAGPHEGRSGMGGLGGNKLNADPAFLQYAAEYNKDIRLPATFQSKLNRFHIASDIINEQNAKADALGGDTLRLAHNFTSDMEPDEYLKMLGLDTDEANKKKVELPAESEGGNNNRRRNRNRRNRRNGGRHLEADRSTVVDHFADGYMSGIKDQGQCGSCWVFAANSTLEGTWAVKNNLQNNAPHFSEQQVVDCTMTGNARNQEMFGKDYDGYGCQGGWMTWAWTFQKEQGIMAEDDYPYTSGTTMTESECVHDEDKTIGKVTSWGQITTGVDKVKEKLREQPLSVALDASSPAFQWYSSGVITADDGCGSWLNHAVVLVGYTDDSNDGDGDGDNNDGDGDGDNNDGDGDTTPACKVNKWWHTCEQDDRRRNLQGHQGHTNYWKVQNSWGLGYGDQGFVRIAIEAGDGVCGINNVVEWAEFESY